MFLVYLKLIVAFALSGGLLIITNKIAPRFYTLRFLSGYYTFQFIAIFVYLLTEPGARIWSAETDSYYLRDYIDQAITGYFIFQFGILLAAFFGYLMFPHVRLQTPFLELAKKYASSLALPLYFTAFVVLAYPVSRGTPVEYPLSILFNYLNFIPFLAGLLFFHNKPLRWVWFIALTVLFVLGILTGGRGAAFASTAFYAIGFYYALKSKRARQIAVVAGIIIAVPLASFMAFVGIFRHIVGRVDFDKITWERVVRIYDKYEKIKDSKVLDLNTSDGKLQSWGRLVNFVNFFQFATIPSKRDYLGWDDLLSVDFYYAFDVSFLSGTTVEERLKAKSGNFRLNDYGYLVTLQSSVEYSVVTEGYIRFGYTGVFIEALILGLFSQTLEFLLWIFCRKNIPLLAFSTVLLCQVALNSYVYNLFAIMRTMILAIVAASLVVLVLQFFKLLFKRR